jgi:FlaA1/EpsC-like NDP-sugar epimerase
MGATKQLAERYVRSLEHASPTRFGVVRFGNVLGSASSVLPIWASQIAEGGPITLTDQRMTRYFMTIPEAAALVLQAAALSGDPNAGPGEVFVLDMGEPVPIIDLARRFAAAHGLRALLPQDLDQPPHTIGAAVRIRITGNRPGEKLHEQLAHDPAGLRPTAVAGIQRWSAEPVNLEDAGAIAQRLQPLCDHPDPGAVIDAIAAEVPDFIRTRGKSDLDESDQQGRAA